MKYIKPHLSPELRAQIAPVNRRDRKLATAGLFFLILSVILTINLIPNNDGPKDNAVITDNAGQQESDKQILGSTDQATTSSEPAPAQEFTSYTVKDGDTLFYISQQYGIKWDLIAQINNLSEPYLLHAGQVLKIPQSTTSKVPNKIYTIKNGDTLASIAKEYNITVADIVAVNPNLQKSDLITVGQVIKLP